MLGRLQSARSASERVLGLLQVCPCWGCWPVLSSHAVQGTLQRRVDTFKHSTALPTPLAPAYIQAFAGAEAAYSRAMDAASKISLVGDSDGPTLRGALDGFSSLPIMMGAAHGQVWRRQLCAWGRGPGGGGHA